MTSYVSVWELNHDLVKNPDQMYEQVLMLETRGSIDPGRTAIIDKRGRKSPGRPNRSSPPFGILD